MRSSEVSNQLSSAISNSDLEKVTALLTQYKSELAEALKNTRIDGKTYLHLAFEARSKNDAAHAIFARVMIETLKAFNLLDEDLDSSFFSNKTAVPLCNWLIFLILYTKKLCSAEYAGKIYDANAQAMNPITLLALNRQTGPYEVSILDACLQIKEDLPSDLIQVISKKQQQYENYEEHKSIFLFLSVFINYVNNHTDKKDKKDKVNLEKLQAIYDEAKKDIDRYILYINHKVSKNISLKNSYNLSTRVVNFLIFLLEKPFTQEMANPIFNQLLSIDSEILEAPELCDFLSLYQSFQNREILTQYHPLFRKTHTDRMREKYQTINPAISRVLEAIQDHQTLTHEHQEILLKNKGIRNLLLRVAAMYPNFETLKTLLILFASDLNSDASFFEETLELLPTDHEDTKSIKNYFHSFIKNADNALCYKKIVDYTQSLETEPDSLDQKSFFGKLLAIYDALAKMGTPIQILNLADIVYTVTQEITKQEGLRAFQINGKRIDFSEYSADWIQQEKMAHVLKELKELSPKAFLEEKEDTLYKLYGQPTPKRSMQLSQDNNTIFHFQKSEAPKSAAPPKDEYHAEFINEILSKYEKNKKALTVGNVTVQRVKFRTSSNQPKHEITSIAAYPGGVVTNLLKKISNFNPPERK